LSQAPSEIPAGSRPAFRRASRAVSIAQARRAGSAPTAKLMRSARRAAIAIRRGPVAATSTGTFGSSRESHARRLAFGASARPSVARFASGSKGTSSPRR
jgi:hypothetical protein